MRGVLLVPSSSPTLSPIYDDGLDVRVTPNITWFYLNHDMASRRIYKLSFYGGHPTTYVGENNGGVEQAANDKARNRSGKTVHSRENRSRKDGEGTIDNSRGG